MKERLQTKLLILWKAENGLITKDDLRSYEPKIRKPITGSYKGYEIYSMPPPSSGGVHIVQMLNILELFPLENKGHNSADYIHLVSETMKLAYADRSKHLGDPDFAPVPTKELTSKEYAKKLSKKINLKKATPSVNIKPGKLSLKAQAQLIFQLWTNPEMWFQTPTHSTFPTDQKYQFPAQEYF